MTGNNTVQIVADQLYPENTATRRYALHADAVCQTTYGTGIGVDDEVNCAVAEHRRIAQRSEYFEPAALQLGADYAAQPDRGRLVAVICRGRKPVVARLPVAEFQITGQGNFRVRLGGKKYRVALNAVADCQDDRAQCSGILSSPRCAIKGKRFSRGNAKTYAVLKPRFRVGGSGRRGQDHQGAQAFSDSCVHVTDLPLLVHRFFFWYRRGRNPIGPTLVKALLHRSPCTRATLRTRRKVMRRSHIHAKSS